MITSTDITEATRRQNVRELANISSLTLTDTELDIKIENADAISQTYFGVDSVSGSEDFARNLITVSNLITSVLIRQGLGGADNVQIAKDQTETYKRIVAAHNKIEPEQSGVNMAKTGGFSTAQLGTFGRGRYRQIDESGIY